MYSEAQLELFFGSNYDANTLPIAFTHNGIMAIVPFLIIMVLFLIINYYKKEKGKNKKNLSSKELVTYSSAHDEDKKANQKQNNIYNKYYFNVYVKPNKNGKNNNYNNKTADIIDAETCN